MMKIVRYSQQGDQPQWGLLEGALVRATEGEPFVDLRPQDKTYPIDDVTLHAPVTPRTVMCVGRNYRAHAEEFGNDVPESPLLFMKPPGTIIGPGSEIAYPTASKRVDHEAELVVVIGSYAHQVSADEAWDYVGGYTCGNDVTARDLQKTDPGEQWTRGKGFATFCPVGPWIETEFDPTDVRVTCTVGGTVRQDGRTRDFIFSIPFLIEYITAFTPLAPGDIIMTGTPEGVAPVDAGETITVAIEGLGELENRLVSAG